MSLTESCIRVRDEMLAELEKNPEADNPILDRRGNPRKPVAWDINSGRCPMYAARVKALEPYVNVISMTTLPDCDRFQHMVIEHEGVYYDAEHVEGCDLDELCRAYDTPWDAQPGGYRGSPYESGNRLDNMYDEVYDDFASKLGGVDDYEDSE